MCPYNKTENQSKVIITGLFIFLVISGAFGLVSITMRDTTLEKLEKKANARYMDKKIDSKISNYKLENLKKETYSLSGFDSGVVLINFWGTFCKPCVDEFPSFVRLARHFSNTKLKIIGVSYDESIADIRRFLKNMISGNIPKNLIIMKDPAETQRDLKSIFGTEKIPETYIIINSRIRAKFIGPVDWDKPEILAMLNYILQTKGTD